MTERRFCAVCLTRAFDGNVNGLVVRAEGVPREIEERYHGYDLGEGRRRIRGWDHFQRALRFAEEVQDPTPGARKQIEWYELSGGLAGLWSVTTIAGTEVCHWHAGGLAPILSGQIQQAIRWHKP